MPSATIDEASESQGKWQYPILEAAIEKIEAYASTNGLANSIVERLINAITSKSLNQTSQTALIKCMYPAGPVSSGVVYSIIGSLGHGTLKASVPTQQALIKWLIMVHDLLEDTAALSRCYGILFNLLDTTSLRADLCHLLFTITRKKHVKLFRILLLNDLSRTAGDEPGLQKLMHVYEGYAPGSLNIGNTSKKMTLGFDHPNAEWGTQLENVQEPSKFGIREPTIRQSSGGEDSIGRAIQSAPATANEGRSAKTARLDDSISELSKPLSTEPTLSDLESWTFQTRASLMPADDIGGKLGDLLTPLFEQELKRLQAGRKAGKALSDILEKVLVLTTSTKTVPKPAIQFLESYLPNWDGQKDQNTIVELLSCIPIQPFEDLQKTIINPLETALLSTSPTSSATTLVVLLQFYTSLLAHWTSCLLSATTPPTSTQTTTIQSLTNHTSTLTLTLLTTTPPTLTTTTSILHHQHTLLPLLSPPLSLPLPPPPPLTISTILFGSPTLATLNTLSSLLAAYKHAFESTSTTRPPADIRTLNATLIDTCNLLFRSRAFNATDPHALGCLIAPEVIASLAEYTQTLEPSQPLGGLFALSSHSALAGLSIAAFREMEEEWADGEREGKMGEVGLVMRHAGPVTQRSLAALGREGGVRIDWRQYRVAVLKWLDGMGVTGIKELGEATMKGLMGDQEVPKASQDTALSQ